MASFQVYTDESGELADSNCVSFAGAILEADDIPAFNRKWKKVLQESGVTYLSMSEAMNSRGEFRTWKDRTKDRDELLESLAALSHPYSCWYTNSTLDAAKFAKYPEALRKKLRGIAYAGFEALIKGIAEHPAIPHDAHFHLVCDLSETYSLKCLKLFHRLRMMHSVYRLMFTALSFADDHDYPPLQIADMLAYCFRQEYLGTPAPIIIRLLSIFRREKRLPKRELEYANGSGLGNGIITLPN